MVQLVRSRSGCQLQGCCWCLGFEEKKMRLCGNMLLAHMFSDG